MENKQNQNPNTGNQQSKQPQKHTTKLYKHANLPITTNHSTSKPLENNQNQPTNTETTNIYKTKATVQIK